VDSASADITIITDRHLLNRILGNMIKNAIEAIKHGETIKIGCRNLNDDTIEFRVHNPGHIQQQNQLQIFRRSFSTKGNGRGLGTYSIKLLGERYLGGKVSFTSSLEKGTTFSLKLPIRLPEEKNK
jgi:signal transduction histidine kinase